MRLLQNHSELNRFRRVKINLSVFMFYSTSGTTRVKFCVSEKSAVQVQQLMCFWGKPFLSVIYAFWKMCINSCKEVTVAVGFSRGRITERPFSIMIMSSLFCHCFLDHKRCLSASHCFRYFNLQMLSFFPCEVFVINILLLGLWSCVVPRTCDSSAFSSVSLGMNPV